jgi:hypothetical protein
MSEATPKRTSNHSESGGPRISDDELAQVARHYGVAIAEALPWAEYDRAVAVWTSRVSKLVTCLCMGGKYYAKEATALPPAKNAKPVPMPWQGGTINVIPTEYRLDEAGRDKLAALADSARQILSEQTGIPLDKWAALVEAVNRRRDLLSWLVIKELIPAGPAAPRRHR